MISPPCEERFDRRMILELLERLERLESRVLVIQADDEADVNAIIVQVIEETAAVGAAVERPSDRVLNESGPNAPGRQAATVP